MQGESRFGPTLSSRLDLVSALDNDVVLIFLAFVALHTFQSRGGRGGGPHTSGLGRFDLDTGATNYHFQMAKLLCTTVLFNARQHSTQQWSTYWNVSPFIDTNRSIWQKSGRNTRERN